MTMRSRLVLAGIALVLVVPNVAIARKEWLLARGDTILVELAPVDPRSLIQGDYMRLDYAIARDLRRVHPGELPCDGTMVVALDQGVARFLRLQRGDTPPGPDEHLLHYRVRGGRIRVASDAFYFQEGSAAKFAMARFGELRVTDDGASVLVGLADAQRRRIK